MSYKENDEEDVQIKEWLHKMCECEDYSKVCGSNNCYENKSKHKCKTVCKNFLYHQQIEVDGEHCLRCPFC